MIATIQTEPTCRLPRSGYKNLPDSLDDFLIETFHRKAAFDQNSRNKDISSYYEKHLFFITVQLRPNLYAAKDGYSDYDAQPIFAAFKGWYLQASRNLLGNRFHKQPTLQPFAIAFLDVEGSRFGQPASTFQTPHLHAVMLVHPKTIERFQLLRESGRLSVDSDPRLSKIDIEPFRDDGRGTGPIVTYAAKFARRSIQSARFSDTFMAYPDLEPRRYPFYANVPAGNGLNLGA